MTSPYRDNNARATDKRRWIRLLVIFAVIVGLFIVVMVLLGGMGGHGPQRHMGLPELGSAALVLTAR